MSVRLCKKIMHLLPICGLLIGLILPVSAVDTVDNGAPKIYEFKNINSGQNYVPGELLVKFKPGVSEDKIKNFNDKHGTQVGYTSPFAGFRKLKIPKGKTVEEISNIYKSNPDVEYAVPNSIDYAFLAPNDPYYKYQWNFQPFSLNGGGINLGPAWDISSGNGVIVAILDTGVAYEDYDVYKKAPDLANTNFVSGYDFVNNDDHANDDNSHGTHVAGTIAQGTNNNYGVAGVAYGCSIMPVKVLDKQGSGTLQELVDGIHFATDHGAKVISMSLGFPSGSYPGPALDEALNYAYNNGVSIVAAAGNDAQGVVSYPAAYDKCIAVGATKFDGKLASYSNYGSAIDVVAPGGDPGVDQNKDGYKDGILQNTFNPETQDPSDFGLWFFSGTSMATPHVSGVAALLISKGANTPEKVRAALQNTAIDRGTPGFDQYYGYGLVNAKAALDYVTSPPSANLLSISDLTVKTSSSKLGRTASVSASALATIKDKNNVPVKGAKVSGQWSGAATNTASGKTDKNGQVILKSNNVKYTNGILTFTFTINNVSNTLPWDGVSKSGTGTYP